MAITIQYQPQDFSPAYNRNEFGITSTNSAETGFKYVVDVYASGGSKIAEYRLRALPSINREGVIDIRKILSTLVSFDFDPTVVSFIPAVNSYYEYDIKFGEEFQVDYSYTAFTNNGGFVQLGTFSSHPFVTGDQVNLTENTPNTNPLLTGLHNVLSVTANTVTIDVVYSDLISPTLIGGFLNYADNRKTIFRDLATATGKVVFNGAFSWMDFRNFLQTDYDLTNVNDKFLTDLPDEFTTTDDAEMYVNIWNQKEALARYMYFENSNGDILYKQVNNTSDEVTMIPVGAGNNGADTVSVGSLPVVKSDTTWYRFWYADETHTAISQGYTINIDRRCEIEPFQILFLDRKGSLIPFAFNLKAEENITAKKDNFNQRVTGYDGGTTWTYDTHENGLTTAAVELDKEFTLNTNWMPQSDNVFFQQLISSPKTWIKLEDGNWYSCIVKDESDKVERVRGRKLIMKTIKIELSNKDVVNG